MADGASNTVNPSFRILSAFYGDMGEDGSAMVDVTQVLRSKVEGGNINVEHFGGMISEAIGDPAPGIPKQLVVTYESEGARHVFVQTKEIPGEGYPVALPRAADAKTGGEGGGEGAPVFEIVSAHYGNIKDEHGGRMVDVTQYVRGEVRDGSLSIEKVGDFFRERIEDPTPGIPKHLAIAYSLDGVIKVWVESEDVVNEEFAVKLP